MRSSNHTGHLLLVLTLLVMCSAIGCPPVGQSNDPNDSSSGSGSGGALVRNSNESDDETNTPTVRPADDPGPVTTDPVIADPGDDEGTPPVVEVVEDPVVEPPTIPVAAPLGNLVPLAIELPAPAFRGTPKPQDVPNVEPPLGKPRPPFLAPEGTVNLSRGKPVSCSDPMPTSGEVDLVTDGDKEASDFGYLGLKPGTEWLQVDLQQKASIYAVLVWHNHAEARVYHDVIVQVSDDPDFLDAQTIFNNDYDGSSGMGVGSGRGYVETSEGKLVDGLGAAGRYVRLYSRGNHLDENNHYTEVEVYGIPAE